MRVSGTGPAVRHSQRNRFPGAPVMAPRRRASGAAAAGAPLGRLLRPGARECGRPGRRRVGVVGREPRAEHFRDGDATISKNQRAWRLLDVSSGSCVIQPTAQLLREKRLGRLEILPDYFDSVIRAK